jgi:hypothetical protein
MLGIVFVWDVVEMLGLSWLGLYWMIGTVLWKGLGWDFIG